MVEIGGGELRRLEVYWSRRKVRFECFIYTGDESLLCLSYGRQAMSYGNLFVVI